MKLKKCKFLVYEGSETKLHQKLYKISLCSDVCRFIKYRYNVKYTFFITLWNYNRCIHIYFCELVFCIFVLSLLNMCHPKNTVSINITYFEMKISNQFKNHRN